MSYLAALQSAAFYFLACSPYHQMRTQQLEKKKAKRDLEARRINGPTAYAHPLPQHTNVYWTEEIMMGPRLQQRKTTTRSYHVPDSESISGTTQIDANISDGTTLAGDSPSSDDQWNKKRYQRPDEELWGSEILGKVGEAISSAGRKLEATLGLEHDRDEQFLSSYYQLPKVPPVNEFHPPIVTNYSTLPKSSHQWMLQPPPPAKFMEGRVPVCRTPTNVGTMTAASRRKSSSTPSLGITPISSSPRRHTAHSSRCADTNNDDDSETDVELVREYNISSMPSRRGRRPRSILHQDTPRRSGSLSNSATPRSILAHEERNLLVPQRRRTQHSSKSSTNHDSKPSDGSDAEDEADDVDITVVIKPRSRAKPESRPPVLPPSALVRLMVMVA